MTIVPPEYKYTIFIENITSRGRGLRSRSCVHLLLIKMKPLTRPFWGSFILEVILDAS